MALGRIETWQKRVENILPYSSLISSFDVDVSPFLNSVSIHPGLLIQDSGRGKTSRATEQTLKHELVPIIGSGLQLDYTTETRPGRGDQVDPVFRVGYERVVLELEVGSHRKLLEGIEQADRIEMF